MGKNEPTISHTLSIHKPRLLIMYNDLPEKNFGNLEIFSLITHQQKSSDAERSGNGQLQHKRSGFEKAR